MNCGQNGRFPSHPLTKLDERGENGRFHPIPWLNLMNVGRTAVPTPSPD
ncbi:MAG: hypothetical protein KBE23_19815 [Chloroflexi bacterium]|nr:hypothetical protein [Chloroflexota bacterium]